MPDRELRDRLLSTLARVPTPPNRIDHVIRRARIIRLRRRLGWTVAGVLIVTGLSIPLTSLLPLARSPEKGDEHSRPADTPSQMLDVAGVQLVAPEGRHARTYGVSGSPMPVIRVATFELPDSDDILASAARQSMGSNDVLMTLIEYSDCPCPVIEDVVSLPLSLGAADFEAPFSTPEEEVPPQGVDVPDAHAFARRTFEFKLRSERFNDTRFFDLWVEFGQDPAPEVAVSEVNDVLASIMIGPWKAIPYPDGICIDVITKDPDCPQTIWLKAVLTEAGFKPIDSPHEQTLVGRGGGATFFIYVDKRSTPLEHRGYPVHFVVGDVTVYEGGGPPHTLVWKAQSFDLFISPGPTGGNTIPGQEGIEALVRATLSVSYPPQE